MTKISDGRRTAWSGDGGGREETERREMRRKTRVSQVITHSDIASAFYTAWKWMLYVPSSLLQLAYLVWADFIQIASFDFRESVALSLKGLTQLSQRLDYTVDKREGLWEVCTREKKNGNGYDLSSG